MKLDHTHFKLLIPLTSISDIAFILLIFIILISLSGASQKSVHLLPEAAFTTKLSPNDTDIIVIVTEDKQYINGIDCTQNRQLALSILQDYNREQSVTLFCQRQIEFSQIRPLLDLFESNGFHSFRFVVKNTI